MILRHSLPGEIELGEFGLRRRHVLLGGAGIPCRRLGRVALDPAAVKVEHRDVELRRAVSALCGGSEPLRRGIEPLRHPLAARVQRTQGELRLGIACFGGGAEPERTFDIARSRTFAAGMHVSQAQHRRPIAYAGGGAKLRFGRDRIRRHAFALQQVQGKVIAGPGMVGRGSLLEQRSRPRRVSGEALPGVAHQRQRDLGIRISLRRRPLVPGSGGGQIAFNSEAVGEDDAEAEFAGGVALLGRGGIPAARLGVIDLAAEPA